MWAHPVSVLGIAGMTWGCVKERWWLVGLFGGIAIWGRLHTAIIVLILGISLAWTRRSPRIALLIGSISGFLLALALVWSHWMYGTWSPAGGYAVGAIAERSVGTGVAKGSLDLLVNHLGLWMAPDRGIFVWTPALLLLLPAMIRSWRTQPDWSRVLLVGGVVYTLIQGQLNFFSGGSGFFGYRLTLELLMCAAPAYALSLGSMGVWARRLLGPVIGLQLGAFVLGALGQGGINNEEHLWTQNAYVYALVHYPALLVWMLLTVFLGWAVGHVVRERTSSASPTQA
jgi:alpha-1,2-mannosyltransferase